MAYADGVLVFDGAGHKVAHALASLLSDPVVAANEQFRRAASLMAVFPGGVSNAMAVRLGRPWPHDRSIGEPLSSRSAGARPTSTRVI